MDETGFVSRVLHSEDRCAAELERLYAAYLGRGPGRADYEYWLPILRATNAQDVESLIASSVEAKKRAGDKTAYIRRVYLEVLGRDATPADLAYWQPLFSYDPLRQ